MPNSINARQKGKRIELCEVHWLLEHGCPSAHRTQQYAGTAGTSDVEALVELPHWYIECKGTKSTVLTKSQLTSKLGWILTARQNCKDGCLWVIKQWANNHKPIAIVDLETFIEITKDTVSPIITPIACPEDSFTPVNTLEHAYKVLEINNIFIRVATENFEPAVTVPIALYKASLDTILVAMEASAWLHWALTWEKKHEVDGYRRSL